MKLLPPPLPPPSPCKRGTLDVLAEFMSNHWYTCQKVLLCLYETFFHVADKNALLSSHAAV